MSETKSRMMRVFSFGSMTRNGSFSSLQGMSNLATSAPLGTTDLKQKEKLVLENTREGGPSVTQMISFILVLLASTPVIFGIAQRAVGVNIESSDLSLHCKESDSICEWGDESCIMGKELFERHMTLSRVTEDPGRINRPYLSVASAHAARQVQAWMEDAGMTSSISIVGNVVGRYEADSSTSNPRTIVLGSHFDSVNDAGKFDGVYGVLAAISVVKVLKQRGQRLPFALEVAAFDDEEGNSSFGTTNTGAKAFMGEYSTKEAAEQLLEQYAGLEEAFRRQQINHGLDPKRSGIVQGLMKSAGTSLQDVAAFIELHIEQGPVLEAEGRPIGIVDAINGQTRMQVRYFGESGHAGTVPMTMRKDALGASAEAVSEIERVGSSNDGLVATVGTLNIVHASSNVVPGEVMFTVDVRAPTDEVRIDAVDRIVKYLESVRDRRDLELQITRTHEAPAVPMNPEIRSALATAISEEGLEASPDSVRILSSGAGHDAMIVGNKIPSAMLFLRCAGGISHNPAERLSPHDATVGARVVLKYLENLKV